MAASAGSGGRPDDAGTVAALFEAADERLLMAKVAGKDRVVLRAQVR